MSTAYTINFSPKASLGSLYTSDVRFPHTRVWIGEAQGERAVCLPPGRMLGLALRNLDAATISSSVANSAAYLESLDMSTSHFSESTLKWLLDVSHLRELRLDFLKLRDRELARLDALSALETLWLTGAEMADGELTAISKIDSLLNLVLKHTRITNEGLVALSGLTRLKNVHLPTQTDDTGALHLSGCKSLTSLDLSQSKITDKALESIAKLGSLTELYLTDTATGDKAMEWVAQVGCLRVLFLSGTKVTDAGLGLLGELPQLEHLELRDTAVSELGIARFKAKLPECAVFGP